MEGEFLNYLNSAFFRHYLVLGDSASPNLRDVLVFLTGSDSIPPVGFGLGEQSTLPTLTSYRLHLPVY